MFIPENKILAWVSRLHIGCGYLHAYSSSFAKHHVLLHIIDRFFLRLEADPFELCYSIIPLWRALASPEYPSCLSWIAENTWGHVCTLGSCFLLCISGAMGPSRDFKLSPCEDQISQVSSFRRKHAVITTLPSVKQDITLIGVSKPSFEARN